MRIRTAMVAGLLLVLAGAGCARGAGQDGGVATASGTARPSTSAAGGATRDFKRDQENFLQYAKCMREHGVPMDDPQMDGGGVVMKVPDGSDNPKVDEANKECKQFLPNGGEPMKADPEAQEQMRKFSQCMRENGVPNFPDPGEDGGIQFNSDTLGVDPQGETFKKAEEACKQYGPKRRGDA
ncbi:hypothetical protein GCM10010399_42070 [Dactylosporangium fulvum]|uniref:Lipoprotein n=1 Tax=Dactylosporangium fulvum TaxID=53359 RepID=A0ABY5W0N0_9ACTN|nr:hypothetical protein [Dactylosporangium fulvum]UWP81611.1 hypothetical protein Dfulv_41930 [Dactylosporangium fulvum]